MRRLIAVLLALLPALCAHAQVSIELDSFGTGNTYRPGDFAGVRLLLSSDLPEATPVWVQIEVPNADGDIGEYGRSLTLTGGQKLGVWLYIPVPADIEQNTVFSVRVFREEDARRGRELGSRRISPSTANAFRVPELMSMIAVVGPSQVRMALDDYTNPDSTTERPPFAHEDTWVTFGLKPQDMPDRWEALKTFEAVVWGGDQFAPTQLTDRQARALRAYVQRGGHFIISLPEAGGAWEIGSTQAGALDALLPPKAPRRDIGVPVSRVLSTISKASSRQIPADIPVTLRVFGEVNGPLDLIEHPWRPLVVMDDGRVIAIQRTYGYGRVTVIGLDLTNRRLTSMSRAVQADILWNRILGRRTDTPSRQELADIEDNERRVTAAIPENNLGGGQLFSQLISMSEQAGRGLLLTFMLFVVYLLAVGPPGFWALKQYKMERHAWVVFAATAGVFTVAAWGLVSLAKPSSYRLRHITYLDMIARPGGDRGATDPQLQRAASWFSLNMPGYSRVNLTIDSLRDQRDLLAPWAPPGVLTQPFPNPDRFRVNVGDSYADTRFLEGPRGDDTDYYRPSRATATQLYANWMGGLDRAWGGTIRSVPSDPARVDVGLNRQELLAGRLIHDLPGELTDVMVIWIKSRRVSNRKYDETLEGTLPWIKDSTSGTMLNTGSMWRLSAPWGPGEELLLSEFNKKVSRIQGEIKGRYVDEYAGTIGALTGSTAVTAPDRNRYLDMYSFFNQLDPPKYLKPAGDQADDTVAFYRLLGRELDLSPWFTGPSLIVIGRLRGADSPIPLRVDGEAPETEPSSLTIVRWMTPFPLESEIAFEDAFEEPSP